MTLSFKHAFTSAKVDGGDNTLLQPSYWNAEHSLTLAADVLVGRGTGAGEAQEISCTAFARSILACSDYATLAALLNLPTTGDGKLTFKSVADAGWIMMDDGTIGDTGSGATYTGSEYQALYYLIYTNVSDTYAPVTGGRGVSKEADWAALKPIALTRQLGRAIMIAGAGASLTARSLGQYLGEENHLLTITEIPSHNHGVSDPGHYHGLGAYVGNGSGTYTVGSGGTALNLVTAAVSMSAYVSYTGISIQNNGGGGTHNNMQPSTAWNVMLKL
jgi:microcystin-dependent protein